MDEFALTNYYEECLGVLTVALEYCPLCGLRKKRYYCEECVNAGEFPRSTDLRVRYKGTRATCDAMKIERNALLQCVESSIHPRVTCGSKHHLIHAKRRHLHYLKKATGSLLDKIGKAKTEIKTLRDANRSRQVKQQRYPEKLDNIDKYIKRLGDVTLGRQQAVDAVRDKISQLAHRHAQDLVRYIFLIEKLDTDCHQTDVTAGTSPSDMTDQLDEASRTVYVKGHWIRSDPDGEPVYLIGMAALPISRDSLTFEGPVIGSVESGSSLGQHSDPAFSKRVALGHLTQVTAVLSCLFDVPLPHCLSAREFSSVDLKESRFKRLVGKLNQNVLELCLSQRLTGHAIHRKQHLVSNLLLLLRLPSAQRPAVSQDAEDFQEDDEDTDAGTDSETDSDDSPTGFHPVEWDEVCPQPDLDTGTMTSTTDLGTSPSLITSAAISVMSLWRAATGQGQSD